MDKYTILIILNLPFVILGASSAFVAWRMNKITISRFITRIVFWLAIGTVIIYAQQIYNYLAQRSLTDSTPLSLADVVLITACNFLLYRVIKINSKAEAMQNTINEFHQSQSIINSKK